MQRMTSTDLYLRLLRNIAPYRHIFSMALLGMTFLNRFELNRQGETMTLRKRF